MDDAVYAGLIFLIGGAIGAGCVTLYETRHEPSPSEIGRALETLGEPQRSWIMITGTAMTMHAYCGIQGYDDTLKSVSTDVAYVETFNGQPSSFETKDGVTYLVSSGFPCLFEEKMKNGSVKDLSVKVGK